MPKSKNPPTKLLWIDLEFTGLDFENDRILEVAAIVTDFDFNELDAYQSVVFQNEEVVNKMKNSKFYGYENGKRIVTSTVYDVSKDNGLIDKIKSEGKPEQVVEKDLVDLVKKHFDTPAILAGNSIHADKRMIERWWHNLNQLLHYRMLDVSSFKILMQGKYQIEYFKPNNHRALEDIRGSIAELKYYLEKLAKTSNE